MQITPEIHALSIPFSVQTPAGPIPRTVNVFLHIGAKVTLIDSGVAGSERRIFSYLDGLGLGPESIGRLILTHSHPDHVGAAKAIKEATGCRVSAHAAERSWIEDTDLQARERPVPGFRQLVGGSVPVDQVLCDGESILLDHGVPLQVVHTPGHSAGSVSFWCPSEQVLLTGDAVPLPGDLPIFDDYHTAVESLLRLEKIEAEWLLSAWDEPRQGAAVRRVLCESLCWLERIREGVLSIHRAGEDKDPMELCRKTVASLGLPPLAVNPIVAKSFLSVLPPDPEDSREAGLY